MGRFGLFLGCSRFPDCKYTCSSPSERKKLKKIFKRNHRGIRSKYKKVMSKSESEEWYRQHQHIKSI